MAYSSIVKPSVYFNTKLYTGNGSSGHSITGVGFQPDWVWIKQRDIAENNEVYDAVRGVTKAIFTDSNSEEVTQSAGLASFNSDGFTVGNRDNVNKNSGTYASWNWKANGAGSANTDGSINSTATSANTTAGFSIVKYTGTGANATVGHGLGVAPSMIIFKNLISSGGSAEHWVVYHKDVGATKGLYLNLTNAQDTSNAFFNDTAPTSSVFYLGNADKTNKSGEAQIAYCFAEKKGFSKFGSYIGNASNDGPFIYTGFKPAFVIAKLASVAGENWYVWDNKRSTAGNVVDKFLYPNLTNAEVGSTNFIDFLSNGFKLRSSSDVLNGSGNTHIYMAFAENPLVANSGTEGVPATAR